MDGSLLLAASCLAVLTVPGCSQRLVGGQDAAAALFPSVASLQLRETHRCGANVLDHAWLLTTAHCVDTDTHDLSVLVGTTNLSYGGSRHIVDTVAVHNNYSPGDSWVNDIALIRVTPSMKIDNVSIATTRLPAKDSGVLTGTRGSFVGWGRLALDGEFPDALQWVETQVVSQEACRQAYAFNYTVHDSQLCCEVPEAGKGACNGDSGGPMVVGGEVVGLASWQYGCAVAGYPTVYTRVSAFVDWIADNMD